MIKFPILGKLPIFFKNHKDHVQIATFLQNSAVRYSSIFIKRGNKFHILLKDGSINVDLDWQAYSLLRASSRLILTTGELLRSEPGIYQQRYSNGDENVVELYKHLTHQRQKIMTLSRSMKYSQLKEIISEDLYEIVDLPEFNSYTNLVSSMVKEQNLPILVECGLNFTNQYFQQVDKGGVNSIDTLLISQFQGKIQDRLIGKELNPSFERHYDLVWKSGNLPCSSNGGEIGILNLLIYKIKPK